MRRANRFRKNSILIGLSAALLSAVPLLGQGYLSPLESNKKVVFDFYRLVVEPRNADLIELYVAADFVEHDPIDQKGSDAVVKMLKTLGRAASDDVGATLRNPPAFIMAQGDLVVWFFPQSPAKAGEPFQLEVYRVKDRKIVEHWKGAAKAP
jgi:predicted SnoaL-like aldol condensation-catalyzing enzyme